MLVAGKSARAIVNFVENSWGLSSSTGYRLVDKARRAIELDQTLDRRGFAALQIARLEELYRANLDKSPNISLGALNSIAKIVGLMS